MTDYVVAFEMAVTVDVEADSEREAEIIARARCVSGGIWARLDGALTGTDFTASMFYDDVEVDEMGEGQVSRSKSDCVTCTKGMILNFPIDAAAECAIQRGDATCPYHGDDRALVDDAHRAKTHGEAR